jgi:hypothetical protein
VSAEHEADLTSGAPAALVVALPGVPAIPDAVWRRAGTAVLAVASSDLDAGLDRLDLTLRRALSEARGRQPSLQLGVLAPVAILDALLARDLAAYVDFVVLTAAERPPDAWARRFAGLTVWRSSPLTSFETLLGETSTLRAGGRLLAWPAPAPTAELMDDLGRLASLFPDALVEVTPAAACDPPDTCRIGSYQRADTQDTIIHVVRRAPGRAAVTAAGATAEVVAISTAVGAAPGVIDSVLPLAPVMADASRVIRLYLPFSAVSSLVLRVAAGTGRIAEQVQVVGARELTAEEVVARHQAQAARQRALVRTLISRAETTLTFEIPAFPAPVTIQAATVILQGEGPTELVQRDVRVNGVAFSGRGVPRLPIVEPERVAAPPLAIALTRAYRYRLEGRQAYRGSDAYVIAFHPGESPGSLFEGRAWIDPSSFALLRVEAIQTNLRGSITASQQIDEFSRQTVGAEPVWLLSRSEMRQLYQGAGVTTPLHRVVAVNAHEINPPDFAERRSAAHASPDIMLRDTPDGLRYLRRERGRGEGAERVAASQAAKVRTLAGGVIVDPNITRPLPFAGLNYTDFDLAGTGAQLNAFYGGAYGQAALAAPSIAGSRWHLVASGFAMLARFHDRAFRDGREVYAENLRQRPFQARAGVLRPITARTSVRAEYVLDLTLLEAADTTSPEFLVPASHIAHGARFALETQRGGWRLEGWWNPAIRAGWRAWGPPGAPDRVAPRSRFQRLGASAQRPWVLGPRVLARVEIAAMGGSNLDRFSRFAFGAFDNRLRGYPSASIRYERGAVARGALVWQPGGIVRVDGFLDGAVVREADAGDRYRGYPGVGAAVEAPGPFSLLLGLEWGYGVKGLNSDGSRGTQVVRASVYKVF